MHPPAASRRKPTSQKSSLSSEKGDTSLQARTRGLTQRRERCFSTAAQEAGGRTWAESLCGLWVGPGRLLLMPPWRSGLPAPTRVQVGWQASCERLSLLGLTGGTHHGSLPGCSCAGSPAVLLPSSAYLAARYRSTSQACSQRLCDPRKPGLPELLGKLGRWGDRVGGCPTACGRDHCWARGQSITLAAGRPAWHLSKSTSPATAMGAVNLHFSEEMGPCP